MKIKLEKLDVVANAANKKLYLCRHFGKGSEAFVVTEVVLPDVPDAILALCPACVKSAKAKEFLEIERAC